MKKKKFVKPEISETTLETSQLIMGSGGATPIPGGDGRSAGAKSAFEFSLDF